MTRKEFDALPADIREDLERQMSAQNTVPPPKLPYSLFLKEFRLTKLTEYSHWTTRRDYRDASYAALDLAGIVEVTKTFDRRTVDFERIIPPGGKFMDEYENLPSGFKYILDGIVKKGWLYDDSPKWLKKGEVTQRKAEKGEDFGIKILIKEIE